MIAETRRGRAIVGAALAALLVPVACTRDQGTEPATDDDRFDRVVSLPYLGFSPEASADGEAGVAVLDGTLASPGIGFYTNRYLCTAKLVDLTGDVLRTWRADPCGKWANGIFLPDGGIAVIGWDTLSESRAERDRARHVLRLDWRGNEIWKASVPAHHDLDQLPDGSILVLTAHMRSVPGIDRDLEVRDNRLTRIGPDGSVMEERSLYDALSAARDLHQMQRRKPRGEGADAHIDLLHANGVDWFEESSLAERDPLYAAGNVLVTFRNQNLLAILRWETGEVLWAWGPGVVEGPHYGRLLPSGNILLFDNGVLRDRSRVLEVDPLTREIVLEIAEGPDGAFYSASRSSAQRLPNGNTLVTVSESGEAFELTSRGELAWRFFNPDANADGHRATFFAVVRHTPACLEAVRAHLAGEAEPDREACLIP